MKLAIKAMSNNNKKELEDIRHMFLHKKKELVNIINGLKQKVNQMRKETAREVQVRDVLLHQEQAITRRLKSEIVRAKDVLMSTEMSIKAHEVFK